MTKTIEERITEFKTLYSGLSWTDGGTIADEALDITQELQATNTNLEEDYRRLDLHADELLARIEQLIEENNKFRSNKIRDLEEENKRLKEKLETMKSGLEKLKKVKITDPIIIAEVFLEQLDQ